MGNDFPGIVVSLKRFTALVLYDNHEQTRPRILVTDIYELNQLFAMIYI